MKVVLVSCGGKKLGHAAPARELYCSPLFRLSLRWAERQGTTYVVSAQHRLVRLDDVIEPYDLRLAQLSRPARVAWGWAILETLRGLHPQLRELVLLAGDVEWHLLAHRPRQGHPDLGRAWDRLDEAMDYAATQIQVGRTRTAEPADLADLPLFARGPRVDQPT